ncbi:MAG TPA: phosphotransferase, partial [Actinopolymorphaceae bacterium]
MAADLPPVPSVPAAPTRPTQRLGANVVRLDGTVRRPLPANAAYVQAVLEHLGRYRWPGAPRFRGVDHLGRQVLEFLPGYVPFHAWQPPDVWSRPSLVRLARLLRQLHDLTVGTVLAGDHDVVCHANLSPDHTVYRDEGEGLRPYALLDWDLVRPGRRVDDVAMLCWRFLELGPARSEPTGPGRLMRLICDAYELGRRDRVELVPTVLTWQSRRIGEL